MHSRKINNQTVGDILKDKRSSLGLSLETVEKELKIKKKYLSIIESNRFQAFSSAVQAKGFLKNYSKFLGLNHEMIVALYRRDYENIDMKRKIEFDDEEQIEEKIEKNKIKLPKVVVTKKHVVILSSILVLVFVGILVTNILRRTFSKPELNIFEPFEIEGEYEGRIAYESDEIIFKGSVEQGSSILVNSIPITLNSDYTFTTESFPTTELETSFNIVSENSLGSKTEMNFTLYKPEEKIDFFNAFISTDLSVSNLVVKSDGIVRFEGGFIPGEPIDITASNTLEITTPDFSKLLVQINDSAYVLESETTIFRNLGDRIEKE